MRELAQDFPIGSVTLSEYDVLFTLSRYPGRTARLRDITGQVFLSQPSVSRMVDRLVGRGLVSKGQDPHDGRSAIVTMTEQGVHEFRAAAVKHSRTISEIMTAALTPDDMSELARITAKLHRNGPGEPTA
ncbi:Transcriptional regulator, MarR family [Mycetocola reblochoni REB411]|uniref:Transcriptional regulator, MarR family n=2 Tax=Mycetocola reblochoni TaxID=331618 RepID=A0A1R4IY65_9MICO|nr:Transcriptional regulator, MarR family [Mycetocola reblochoni REB411]